MGRQGGILGCGSSCLWCHPCSEHCSTNLPASSCLPPGQQHPSGPAELLSVCFTSGLGRKSQTMPHVREQVPCTGMSLLTSVIPVAGEDLNQKDFFICPRTFKDQYLVHPNHTLKQPVFSSRVLSGHQLHAATFIFLYLCISITYLELSRLLLCVTNPVSLPELGPGRKKKINPIQLQSQSALLGTKLQFQ